MNSILDIKNLSITFPSAAGPVRVVEDVSLSLHPGQTFGLVGESGSGKSVTALSVMRLLSPAASVERGEILFQGADILKKSVSEMRAIRGGEMAMIFQETGTSLNPVFRCGTQIVEAIRLDRGVSAAEARDQTLAFFEKVRLPDPQRIFNAFPHEISGGQKQRVMIAMAICRKPKLLIADEPTTALDVTVQRSILDLLSELKAEYGLSMLFISHDLGVIGEICQSVAVMQKGKIVESGPIDEMMGSPEHAYTRGLLSCRPSLRRRYKRLPTVSEFLKGTPVKAEILQPEEIREKRAQLESQPPLLSVKNLSLRYPVRGKMFAMTMTWLQAFEQIDFNLYPGECLGLAGESGCGKTSLGKTLVRLERADKGSIWFENCELSRLTDQDFHAFRPKIQLVFQDPASALNPKMRVGETLSEPMRVHGLFQGKNRLRERVVELLEMVDMGPEYLNRLPHELSGGQKQRVSLARALALEPQILICDEIVSALDVSVQAHVLNLLSRLREKLNLSLIFISHDLAVINQMCDRVLIMNQGKIDAQGAPEELFVQPPTDYVKKLIYSVPGTN